MALNVKLSNILFKTQTFIFRIQSKRQNYLVCRDAHIVAQQISKRRHDWSRKRSEPFLPKAHLPHITYRQYKSGKACISVFPHTPIYCSKHSQLLQGACQQIISTWPGHTHMIWIANMKDHTPSVCIHTEPISDTWRVPPVASQKYTVNIW